MDGRRTQLIDPLPDDVPTLQRAEPEPRPEGRRARVQRLAGGQLTDLWAAVLGLGWPLAFMAVVAVEPAPVDPEAATPLLIELSSLVFIGALGVTVVGAAVRHWAAAPAGVAAGLVAAAFSITCPVSGHHSYGLWWVAQLAVIGTMLVASAAALGQRSRVTDSR